MRLKHYQKNFTNQVINFIEYLKLSYIDTEALENVTIKSKNDLKEKLQKGLDDIKANRAVVVRIGHAFMDWEKYLKEV